MPTRATDHPNRVDLTDDYYDGLVFPVPDKYDASFFASDEDKWYVLEHIGIPRRDTTPLRAWRDAVADASGIDRDELDPQQGGALDLGFSPAYVRQFVFWLA